MTLAGTDIYDTTLGFLLHRAGYDSLQLTFQPKGGQNPHLKWHTEMWDLRDVRQRRVEASKMCTPLRVPPSDVHAPTHRTCALHITQNF